MADDKTKILILKKLNKNARNRKNETQFQTEGKTLRKLRKAESDRRRGKSRIAIGNQMERWNLVKHANGLDQHQDVARMLIDSYEAYQKLIGVQNIPTCPTEMKCDDLMTSSDDLASNGPQFTERTPSETSATESSNNVYQKDGLSWSLVDVTEEPLNKSETRSFGSKPFAVLKSLLQPTNGIIANKHINHHQKCDPLIQLATKTTTTSSSESVSISQILPNNQSVDNRNSVSEPTCAKIEIVPFDINSDEVGLKDCNLPVQTIKTEVDEKMQLEKCYDGFCKIKTESMVVLENIHDDRLTKTFIDSTSVSKNGQNSSITKHEISSIASEHKCSADDKPEANFFGYQSLDDCYVTFADESSDDEPKRKRKFTNDEDEDYLPSDCEEDNCADNDSDDSDDDDDYNCHDIGNGAIGVSSYPTDDGVDEPTLKMVNNEYTCSYCPQTRSNVEDAKAHILTHYKFHCQACDEKFLTEHNLKVHNKKHNKSNNSTVFTCLFSGCEYTGKTKTAVSKHTVAAHSKEQSFVCAWCGSTSRTVSAFNRHVLTSHYISDQFNDAFRFALCFSCGCEFRRSDLKEHMLYTHGIPYPPGENDGTIVCDICGEVCRNRRLKWHKITKHAEKTVPCEFEGCTMLFKAEYFMKKHYKSVHLGIKKFNCSYEGCRFAADYKPVLKSHINCVHLKNRTFPCSWPGCEKSFYHKRHLVVHLRIHTDQKPHGCDLCDYRCRQRTALNWHMRKKHPNEVAVDHSEGSSANDSERSKDHESKHDFTPVGIPAVTHAKKPGRKRKQKNR